MSLATNLQTAFTRVGTEFKTIRTLISGTGTGTVSGLTTTATNLVGAINEVKASVGSAGATNLDGLTDVVVASPVTGHVLRHNGTNFVNVLGTTYYEVSGAAASAQTAAQAYADGILDANNAYQYKGVIDCSASPNYPAASAGWTYKVSVAGKIGGASGVVVEVGDTITCLVDSSAAGTQAAVGANWIVTQTNIDGAVVGPASSVAADFVSFSGTTGKVIQDSGISLDTDAALGANSNARVPSQAAVRGYTYSQTQIGDPTTDFAATFVAALA